MGTGPRSASNGAEAKALILEDGLRPDLLLTDVVMPGMSGAALVEELRRIMPDLKFVFMSGYPDTAIARHRIPNAAFDFLQKPFSIRDLANKIETVLGPTGPPGTSRRYEEMPMTEQPDVAQTLTLENVQSGVIVL